MSWGIARVQKFSTGSVKGIEIHDLRAKNHSHTNKDIDFAKSDLNYELHPRNQELTFRQAVNERIKSLELNRAVRQDAKVMCQVLVTSDKEFFDGLGREEFDKGVPNQAGPFKGTTEKQQQLQKQFFIDSYNFICQRYGKNNIISAAVHLDEKTPHMHVNFVPVTIDGRLSAKDVIGNRSALNRFQTQFYEQVFKNYGLERGIEGSKTRHQTVAEFKASTAKVELEAACAELEAVRMELTSGGVELASVKAELANTKLEVEAAKMELVSIGAELKAAVSNTDEVKGELKTVKAELGAVEMEVGTTKTELEDTKLEVIAAKTELTAAKTELANIKLETDFAELGLKSIEFEIDAAKERLAATKSELEIAEFKTNSAKAELKAVGIEVGTAKAELEAIKAEQEVLEFKINTAEAQLEYLESQTDPLRHEHESLEHEYENLINYVDIWRLEANELSLEKDNLSSEIDHLQNIASERQNTALKLQDEVNDLEEKIRAGNSILDALNGILKTKNQILNTPIKISRQIFGKEDSVTIAKKDYDSLVKTALSSPAVQHQEKLKVATENLKRAEGKISELEPIANRVSSLEDKVKHLTQEVEQRTEELSKRHLSDIMKDSKKDADIRNLQREIGNLRAELKETPTKIFEKVDRVLGNITATAADEFLRGWEIEESRELRMRREMDWDGPSL